PINLLGWALSDDPTTPGKWRFPYQEIAPNEYLVVFASGKDRAYDVEALRQDFHATPDGTFLIDLAAGTYDVRLTLGDSQRARDNVAIHVQGQVVDTVSTFAGQFVQPTYEATVDSDSGNQLAIRLEDLGGETGRAALAGLMVTPRDGGEPLRFDFGIDNSPLAEGFQRITSDDSYTPTVGRGWADGPVLSAVDRGADTAGLHTNFKLSAGGENVALVGPDGQIHSQFGPDGADYPEQFPDIAYGLASVQLPLGLEATSVAYIIPAPEDAALGRRWTGLEFDDTEWSRGDNGGISSGIGFGDDLNPANNVRAAMLGSNASLYLRQEFQVDNPADVAGLVLQMQYDDGFVAYLNGVKVADSNAPDVLTWNAEATGPNFVVADSWEEFEISPYTGALVAGTNVLAIHGLNRNPADLDMFIGAKLVASAPVNADTAVTGYLQEPTPGRFNTPIRSAAVTFDQESRFFTEPLSLRLAVDAPGATIFVTTDGTAPSEASAVYDPSQPIEIATTTLVQAISVAPGGAPSATTSVWFVTTSPGLNAFDSNLPIVVLDNFGAGRTGSLAKQLNAFAIFEPDEQTGRSRIDGSPDLVSRAGLKRRGSSTAKRDKASYALEAWDENGKQREIAPLGLPSDSDWILYAPLDFDRALIRNPLIYELSNQIGRYAVRTRFVEVYQNLDGGDLAVEDYRGVYVLMEKIKRGPDRVDITGLEPKDETEPAVSGGWMLKIDRKDPSDRGGFSAASQRIRYVDPKEADVTPRQTAWIRNYFDRMYAS
ncbi:MAG: CotH kinase family protein, partial [Pirellulales bacterium]